MKVASLKQNFALNLVNTLTGLLFPLVTFPYASRILLADGIGQVQFFLSIIDYISLFTSIGIPIYAVREVARVRNDALERSRVSTEILLLHGALTLVGYLLVFIVAATVTKIQSNIPLFMILSATLLFNTIGVPWLYQAVEDFKYITIRSVIMRVVCAVALFVLVKDRGDLLWYAVVLVAGTVGNNIFNFIRIRRYVDVEVMRWSDLKIKRHMAPSLRLFMLNLIVSIYIQLDTIMLGFMKSDADVGYYTSAMKATKIIHSIVGSFSLVLTPRFSNLVHEGRTDEFVALGNKSISVTLAMVFPFTAAIILLAHPIIMLLSGPSFAPAVLTMQLIAPVVIFIGLNGIVYRQMLFPMGKENIVTICALVGAVVNVGLNLLLIPRLSHYGAALASSVAEFSVLTAEMIIGWKFLKVFSFFKRGNMDFLTGTLLMSAVIMAARHFIGPLSPIAALLLYGILGAAVYILFLAARKNEIYLYIYNTIIGKLRKNGK